MAQIKLTEVYTEIVRVAEACRRKEGPGTINGKVCAAMVPVVCPKGAEKKVLFTLNEFVRASYLNSTQLRESSALFFDVYPLESYLLAFMKKSTRCQLNRDTMWIRVAKQCNSSEFDNLVDQKCQYHEDMEAVVCALDGAKKICYTSLSTFDGDFDVKMALDSLPSDAKFIIGKQKEQAGLYEHFQSARANSDFFVGGADVSEVASSCISSSLMTDSSSQIFGRSAKHDGFRPVNGHSDASSSFSSRKQMARGRAPREMDMDDASSVITGLSDMSFSTFADSASVRTMGRGRRPAAAAHSVSSQLPPPGFQYRNSLREVDDDADSVVTSPTSGSKRPLGRGRGYNFGKN